MGGTRFSAVGTAARVDRATHDAIAADAIRRLAPLGVDAGTIPALLDKEDFGDVDLVCARSGSHAGVAAGDAPALAARDAAMARAVGATDHQRGGSRDPALHMLVEGPAGPVQLDLVSIPDGTLDFARSHMSWGDVGTLVAIVGRQWGLKVGMTGIHLTADVPGAQLRSPVPLDWRGTLGLLGFDADRHEAGFRDRRETFEWLADCAQYDPAIFDPARLTNSARQRAMKRPAYRELLDWMATERRPARYDWGRERGEATPAHRDELLRRFPAVAADLEAQAAARAERAAPAFLCGDVVTEVTGVRGDRLQFVLHAVRLEIGRDGLERMAAANDRAALDDVIRRHAGAGEGKVNARVARRAAGAGRPATE